MIIKVRYFKLFLKCNIKIRAKMSCNHMRLQMHLLIKSLQTYVTKKLSGFLTLVPQMSVQTWFVLIPFATTISRAFKKSIRTHDSRFGI